MVPEPLANLYFVQVPDTHQKCLGNQLDSAFAQTFLLDDLGSRLPPVMRLHDERTLSDVVNHVNTWTIPMSPWAFRSKAISIHNLLLLAVQGDADL
jgi:hypothetical protein